MTAYSENLLWVEAQARYLDPEGDNPTQRMINRLDAAQDLLKIELAIDAEVS